MSATSRATTPRWLWISAVLYSVTVFGIGLWISVLTGDLVPLLCASALVVLPVGSVAAFWTRS